MNSTLSHSGVYNGHLSPETKKQIKERLDKWLADLSKKAELKNLPKDFDPAQPYPTFITLTLPSKQVHTDQIIKEKCFLFFFDRLSVQYDIKNYFWKADYEENGNIRFHLVIDKYIHSDKLRAQWNHAIEFLGYVTRYRKTMLEFHKDGFAIDGQRLEKDLASFQRIVNKFNTTGKMPKICNAQLLELLKESKSKSISITEDHIMIIAQNVQMDAYYLGQYDNWANPSTTQIDSILKFNRSLRFLNLHHHCLTEQFGKPPRQG
ncbi:hypothetical protein [Emticicia sp. BO119]|uniref:hypothetical protein n=1 Tax=Emticicia sp. BO119 TaxID=2757768 RepID=UPI0015F0878C|nr:hypothetical protein [Emticicia sp. BO119]MBA4849456.1 hypothetical protein [Emticicia sp. BO119]